MVRPESRLELLAFRDKEKILVWMERSRNLIVADPRNRLIVRSHVTSKSPMRALAVRDEILAQ